MKKTHLLIALLINVSFFVNSQCNLQASFTYYQSNDSIYFTSTSQNTNSNTSYYWTVNGNPITNYGQWANYYTNGNSGWMQACLTITDSSSTPFCSDNFCDSIYVQPDSTQCDYQVSIDYQIIGDSIQFYTTSTGSTTPTSFTWVVNGVSGGNNPTSTVFNNLSSPYYNVGVGIWDGGSCSDSIYTTIVVDTSSICNLQASFTYYQSNDSIYFTSTSQNTNSNTSYYWTVNGNPITNYGQWANYYTNGNSGWMQACLTITDSSSTPFCSDNFCDSIYVQPDSTQCDYQVSIDYQIIGDSIQFYTTSTGSTTPTSFTWVVNGVSGGNNPTSTVFNNLSSPYYNVGVGIWDANGCSDSIYTTIVVDTSSTCNLQVSFAYNVVGDSINFYSTSTGVPANPNYSWTINGYGSGGSNVLVPSGDTTYNVCLTIWNNNWTCSDTLCQTLTIVDSNSTTTCNLQVSFAYNIVGDSVQFYSTSTGVPANPNYSWTVNSYSSNATDIWVPLNDSIFNPCLTIWNNNWTCSDTVCQYFDFSDSTNSLTENSIDFNIYPNPVLNEFTISITDDLSYDLMMYNMLGEEVFYKNNIISKSIIDVTELPKGIYLIKIYDQSNQRVRVEKVVVE